jgi:hypothetical protein
MAERTGNSQIRQLYVGTSTGTSVADGNMTISGTATAITFSGDLNGTINTATTGTTQSVGDNSTLIATTAYADAAAASVSGGVQSVGGTANRISSSGGNTPVINAITGAVSSASTNLATGAQIQTAIDAATTGALKFISEWDASGLSGGSPDLTVTSTHIPGSYYIVSAAGASAPNGSGTTPNSWAVGDWCIRADLATDTWQKIDNTQVGNVTGNGVFGQLAYWNNTSNLTSESRLTFTSFGTTGRLLTVDGSLTITGNSLLGNASGDYVHVNDKLYVGATDSGNAEFWFGEGTTGDVNYGARWYWDSGYTHQWYTVNNSTETLMMSYATNDLTKVQWYRNFDMNNNKIIQLATPTASTDAANKAYVDAVPDGNVTTSGLTSGRVSFATSGTNIEDTSNFTFTSSPVKLDVNGLIQGNALSSENTRVSSAQQYPVGHYSSGEVVWEMDSTWSSQQLADYFNASVSNVYWTNVADAPGGSCIYINGNVNVGGSYTSGFPYIPVETDSEPGDYYMECWIQNVGTNQTHYMGSMDFNESFGSLGGNPGSYGYFVMSNHNPGLTWQKVSGYIGGFHATQTGRFELGTKYWTAQALLNYGAGSGTRACRISGWKIIKTQRSAATYKFPGALQLPNVANANTDTDKFAVIDGDNAITFRTGAQVLSDIGAASTGSLGNYLPLAGGTLTGALTGTTANFAGDVTVGSITKTSDTVINSWAGDSNKAGFEARGSGQGTGYFYVGQSTDYGGGFFYNGDGSPAFPATGEGADQISFYRKNGGTNEVVFYYGYGANHVYFRGGIDIGVTANATTDTDKFLVSDSGEVKYRTGAQVLSDIGGASSGSLGNYLPLAGGTMSGTITMGTQNFAVAGNYGRGVFGLYDASKYQHVWSMGTSYKLADAGTSTGVGGNLYGLAWSYNPGYGGAGNNAQSKAGLNHQLLLMQSGTTSFAAGVGFWTSGSGTVLGNLTVGGTISGSLSGNATSASTATYATTAGSAPNGSNQNTYYNVTAGTGYGLRFWSSNSYKISMGSSNLYFYGPVTDYSIKTQMDAGSTGRGFTWGREGQVPIAGLNSTSGNFQIAGNMSIGSSNTSYGLFCSTAISGTNIYANSSGGSFVFGASTSTGQYIQGSGLDIRIVNSSQERVRFYGTGGLKLNAYSTNNTSSIPNSGVNPIQTFNPANGSMSDTTTDLGVMANGDVVGTAQEATFEFTRNEMNALPTANGSGITLISAPGTNKFVVVEKASFLIYYSYNNTTTSTNQRYEIDQDSNDPNNADLVAYINGEQINSIVYANGAASSYNYGMYENDTGRSTLNRTYRPNKATTLRRISSSYSLATAIISFKIKLRYRVWDVTTF